MLKCALWYLAGTLSGVMLMVFIIAASGDEL